MYRWACPVCLSISMLGCQSADELATDPEMPEAAPVSSAASSAAPPIAGAASAETQPAEVPPTAVAQFSPPFPDRLDLFEPPKRAQGTIRRNEQDGETVELKGFVNVDRPRVVLSIDGVISPIHEGGEKYGVQVISIQPPSVVLQRGRSRWTATLE